MTGPIAVEGELMPGFRRRVIRTYAVYLLLLLVSALALFASDAALRFVGVALISTWATMLVGLTAALVRVRERLRTWPPNRIRARELAQQQLRAAE